MSSEIYDPLVGKEGVAEPQDSDGERLATTVAVGSGVKGLAACHGGECLQLTDARGCCRGQHDVDAACHCRPRCPIHHALPPPGAQQLLKECVYKVNLFSQLQHIAQTQSRVELCHMRIKGFRVARRFSPNVCYHRGLEELEWDFVAWILANDFY